jgi:hypothetical protein
MNKKILLIIIILAVILGLTGYYVYNIYLVKPTVDGNINVTDTPGFFNVNISPNNQNINSADNQPQVDVSKDDKSEIQSLAIIFGQNFGSYSNQTNLNNFDDIYGLMGASMNKWAQDTYKAQIMQQHPQSVYYAIEAKVLNVQITKIDEAKNTATALLKIQRQEFTGSPENVEVFNQDLLLNLIKVNGDWIVDSAYWQ